jgi:nitrate/nitrite-specific signal transduction histidine kinase
MSDASDETQEHEASDFEEEDRLANLYVASTQLHGTLDLKEVVSVILEICLNLVGAARATVYVHDEERGMLVPVAACGGEVPGAEITLGEGLIGEAVAKGQTRCEETAPPVALIPLIVSDRTVGAVVVHALLPQKARLSTLDHALFEMLSRQGATALYGAYLAAAVSHKIRAGEIRSRLEA